MHLQKEGYAGMNKSILLEEYFYNYLKFSKIVENISTQYISYFLRAV